MSRSIKLFITVSVLLNLLLAGAVVGQWGRCAFGPGARISAKDIAAALPLDKRQMLEKTVSSAEAENSDLRAEVLAAREKTSAILKAEPFDRAAYLAQVSKTQMLRGQMMQNMAVRMADLAANYTPEERAVLAELFRRPPPPLLSEALAGKKPQ